MNSDVIDFASLAPAYPEMLLAVGALAMLMLGVVLNKDHSPLISWLSLVLLLAAGAVVMLWPVDGILFNGVFVGDAFARFMKVVIAGGAALSGIGQISKELADLIMRISRTTENQAESAELVAHSIQRILLVTEQTSEGTQQTAGSILQLSELARELKNSVSRFRVA